MEQNRAPDSNTLSANINARDINHSIIISNSVDSEISVSLIDKFRHEIERLKNENTDIDNQIQELNKALKEARNDAKISTAVHQPRPDEQVNKLLTPLLVFIGVVSIAVWIEPTLGLIAAVGLTVFYVMKKNTAVEVNSSAPGQMQVEKLKAEIQRLKEIKELNKQRIQQLHIEASQ